MKTNFNLLVIFILLTFLVACGYTKEERAANGKMYDEFMELSAGSYFTWEEWDNKEAGFFVTVLKRHVNGIIYKVRANRSRKHQGSRSDRWLVTTNSDYIITSIELED